jgi:hypothetical protein
MHHVVQDRVAVNGTVDIKGRELGCRVLRGIMERYTLDDETWSAKHESVRILCPRLHD